MTPMQRAIEDYRAIVVDNISRGATSDVAKEQAIALFRIAACCLPEHPAVVRLYYVAEYWDDRYSAAVAAVTGGRRNRWEMTKEEAARPEVADAFARKKAADAALLDCMRRHRS